MAAADRQRQRNQRQGSRRTCVGTRQEFDPNDLVRVIAVPRDMSPWRSVGRQGEGETIALDLAAKAPGRGAWLYPAAEAVVAAVKRGGFQRAFKRRLILPEVDELKEAIEVQLANAARENLSLARRARAVVAGETAVMQSMKSDRSRLLVVASDISEGNRRKFSSNAQRKNIDVVEGFPKVEQGRLMGMPVCSVVSVEGEPFASRIKRRLVQWRTFGGPVPPSEKDAEREGAPEGEVGG